MFSAIFWTLKLSSGILKLSIIYNIVTVTKRCKKPLYGSAVNSQASLLFLNIIESKYENGLSCDSSENLRKLSVFITQEIRKILSLRKLDKKAGIFCCERMETIIHFRKNMIAQPSFYYKRLYTRLRKPNYESFLVTNTL